MPSVCLKKSSARLRKKSRVKIEELPPNLYCHKGYYRYRNPETEKYHGLGRDRNTAIQIAMQSNEQLLTGKNTQIEQRVQSIINPQEFKNLREYCEYFETEILPQRRISPVTLTGYLNMLRKIKQDLGRHPIEGIDVKGIASFLQGFPAQQSNRFRSILMLLFKYAMSQGLCPNNPAAMTLPRPIQIKRRALTQEQFDEIYRKAPLFLQNAMKLGLYTLLRREDLCWLKIAQIKGNFIEVVVKKNGAALRIAMTRNIRATLDRCLSPENDSPFVISHHYEKVYKSKVKEHWMQVLPDFLTKAFATVRDKTGLFKDVPIAERPTFHEVRALGAHLYERKGIAKSVIQNLLGHHSEKMTEHYLKRHTERFIDVLLE